MIIGVCDEAFVETDETEVRSEESRAYTNRVERVSDALNHLIKILGGASRYLIRAVFNTFFCW